MKNSILLTYFVFISIFGFSQKQGEYLSEDSPVNNLWEAVDGENSGAYFLGESQQFIFLLPDGADDSMMAPFELDGMGFACPSYFTISMDKQFLYFDIHETCVLGVPEEDLFVKIAYTMNDDDSRLILTIDEEPFEYKEWEAE